MGWNRRSRTWWRLGLNEMRSLYAAMFLVASSALAQGVIDPAKLPAEWQDFESVKQQAPKLACSVTPIKPRLNYSFRFQTGFVVQVPMRQYRGKDHWMATLFRVTPEAGDRPPVYFLTTAKLPEIPETNVSIELGGGYVVGEGKYRVELMVRDDQGRACADDWTINAKLGRKENDVPPGMSPGEVDEISLRKWTRGSTGPSNQQGLRVTVLMNASAIMPRRVRLGGYDRVLLLSSLASLVERLPLRSVRLVVFSLDQQREIYREEEFEPADFGKVSQALSSLELGTVDYTTLQNRTGHIDLIADLVRESYKDAQSDAVIFLGPKPWYFDKVQRSALPPRTPDDPPFFYVQFRPFIHAAAYTDSVTSAVKQMGGKTFDVYTPGDFAQAIRDMRKLLGESVNVGAEVSTPSPGAS